MPTAYIRAYHNSPTAENLAKIIIHDYQCDLLIIAWYVYLDCWFVPVLQDPEKKIADTNNNKGWYFMDEPTTQKNMLSKKMLNLKYSYHEISVKGAKIILGWNTNVTITENADKTFSITAFLENIYTKNLIERFNVRQELMLSNISHIIKTPLNGIIHMTKDIIEGKTDDSKTCMKYLNQSVMNLATGIMDVIDTAKLEMGKILVEREILNIRDLVCTTIDIIQKLYASHPTNIGYNIDSNVPEYIYSDKKRLKQIIINLIENAIHHTPCGEIFLNVSAITVDLNAENGNIDNFSNTDQHEITFSVKDSGMGLSPEAAANVFKPDELAENSKSNGMHIKISYMLAKLLNGNLKLDYSYPNIGSSYSLRLVVYEEEPPIYVNNTLKNLNGKSILFITDTGSKVIACKVFEKHKINYITASHMEELILLHNEKKFDLIVMQVLDINNFDIKSIYGKTPILIIGDHIRRDFTYTLAEDYDMESFKLKIVDIFHHTENFDNTKIRILFVEDEQINRIVMEKILRVSGFTAVTICSTALEALNIYKNNKDAFDIILTDIRLPIMSGFEMADAMYKINPNVKILGVTAQLIMENEIRPYMKEFLYKPIETDKLQKKIKEMYYGNKL